MILGSTAISSVTTSGNNTGLNVRSIANNFAIAGGIDESQSLGGNSFPTTPGSGGGPSPVNGS